MVSLGVMVEQVEGLLDSNDLSDWEQGFVRDMQDGVKSRGSTEWISPKQVVIIDRIWSKHFA